MYESYMAFKILTVCTIHIVMYKPKIYVTKEINNF